MKVNFRLRVNDDAQLVISVVPADDPDASPIVGPATIPRAETLGLAQAIIELRRRETEKDSA